MLQRIQTVYMLFAAACGFSTLALPLATTPGVVQGSGLFSDSVFTTADSTLLIGLFALAAGLAMVGVFLFRQRPRQMQVVRGAMVVNIVGMVLIIILFWQDLGSGVSLDTVQDGLGAYLPLLFLLFAALALRSIRKDEQLVRSADRLR